MLAIAGSKLPNASGFAEVCAVYCCELIAVCHLRAVMFLCDDVAVCVLIAVP